MEVKTAASKDNSSMQEFSPAGKTIYLTITDEHPPFVARGTVCNVNRDDDGLVTLKLRDVELVCP